MINEVCQVVRVDLYIVTRGKLRNEITGKDCGSASFSSKTTAVAKRSRIILSNFAADEQNFWLTASSGAIKMHIPLLKFVIFRERGTH